MQWLQCSRSCGEPISRARAAIESGASHRRVRASGVRSYRPSRRCRKTPRPINARSSRLSASGFASRPLRALIGRGIFKQLGDGRYDLTPLARTLRWDAPDSMAALASFIGSPQDREHWSHCVDAIRTGESVVPKLRGMEGFDWFASDPEVFDVFNQAMTNFSELAVAPVTAAYDFGGYRTIVDVGGGHGRLLAGILATAPTAKGILFDLPDVVGVRAHCCGNTMSPIASASPKGRSSIRPPRGCDLYVMKNIIHDWPDDRARQILNTVRGAARDGATLLLVECVIPPHDRDFLAKWSDLGMLVDNTGRERTAEEYRDLLHHVGFQMTRVVPTASLFSIVEAEAA